MVYALDMTEKFIRLLLRLPPRLHEALTDWAREEHRSLNGQIVHVLERAVEGRDAKSR